MALNETHFQQLVGTVDPRDDMFTGSHERYHAAGISAIVAIGSALASAQRNWSSVQSCLDLPCGYGRVLRHLVQRLPADRITACDLTRTAVDFCARQFGVRGVYSKENLREVTFAEPFDLIWVGSLFTHLPYEQSVALMSALTGALSDTGVLVFSAVGDDSLDRMLRAEGYAAKLLANKAHQDAALLTAHYLKDGWAFVPYAGSVSYGLTFLSTDAALDLIEEGGQGRVSLLGYQRAGWNHDHDIYSVSRQSASPLQAARELERATLRGRERSAA